jgi:quinol-cytochrome oxidoreductase complex cytochrome b subunit
VRLQRAYKLCQNTSSNRTHTATTFLLVGVVPLLIVLTLPALSRRSRRSRSRRRVKF